MRTHVAWGRIPPSVAGVLAFLPVEIFAFSGVSHETIDRPEVRPAVETPMGNTGVCDDGSVSADRFQFENANKYSGAKDAFMQENTRNERGFPATDAAFSAPSLPAAQVVAFSAPVRKLISSRPARIPQIPAEILHHSPSESPCESTDRSKFERRFKSVRHLTTTDSLVVQARNSSAASNPFQIEVEFINNEKLTLFFKVRSDTLEADRGRLDARVFEYPGSQLVITYNDRVEIGILQLPGKGVYRIFHEGRGVYRVLEYN